MSDFLLLNLVFFPLFVITGWSAILIDRRFARTTGDDNDK
jgi:hypothetical protein